jgi:hypothetical protein
MLMEKENLSSRGLSTAKNCRLEFLSQADFKYSIKISEMED